MGRTLAAPGAGQIPPGQNPTPPTMRLLHWARMPVRVYLTPGEAATKERCALARAGFDEWVRASRGAVGYRIVGDPAQADLTVMFDPDASLPGQKGVAGCTTVTSAGDTITQGRIELAAGQDAPELVQDIAAHEFGHALGIEGHSAEPDDLMFPVEYRLLPPRNNSLGSSFAADPLFWNPAHKLTARDLETLRACYPALFAAPTPRP